MLTPQKPGFGAVVILTLALGIGANAAIFSLIYGILLRPFPYRDAGRIVRVEFIDRTGNVQGRSQLDQHRHRASQSLTEMFAVQRPSPSLCPIAARSRTRFSGRPANASAQCR